MASSKIPLIAIVGRTNVGKSSLFNALVGRRLALVKDAHGVTRDRHYALVTNYDSPFTLVDTGGLVSLFEDQKMGEIFESVRAQTKLALDECDGILVVFDAAEGVNPMDEQVVNEVRLAKKPVWYVANKSESPNATAQSAEFYKLGIKKLILASAAHRQGLDEIAQAIIEDLSLDKEGVELPGGEPGLHLAIVGRPNVGKSSLVNRLIGQEKQAVSPIPGTTSDSINHTLEYNGERYILVDTAGLRRKARVDEDSVEYMGNLHTVRSLAEAQVAVLVLDAGDALMEGGDFPTDQDERIASLVHERGRSMLIAVNKWDLVGKDHTTAKAFRDAIYSRLHFCKYAPILFVSAHTGKRCVTILEKAKQLAEAGNKRIPASDLNRVLNRAFQKWPPPVIRGEPVRLYFATQTGTMPPRFTLYLNYPQELDPSYQRYLKNNIREEFVFEGSDIKLVLRKRTEKENRKRAEEDEALLLAEN